MIDLTLHEGITTEQMASLHRLYSQSKQKRTKRFGKWEIHSISFGEFASKAEIYRDYIGIGWCGMFVGIEKDGYTHT